MEQVAVGSHDGRGEVATDTVEERPVNQRESRFGPALDVVGAACSNGSSTTGTTTTDDITPEPTAPY